MAKMGKINCKQTSQEALENVVEFLEMVKEIKDMVTPVKTPVDLFTMPMSYVLYKAQETFFFMSGVIDMFEYVPFPMTMFTSEDHVVVPRPGYHNFQDINQREVLSSSELSLMLQTRRECTTANANKS